MKPYTFIQNTILLVFLMALIGCGNEQNTNDQDMNQHLENAQDYAKDAWSEISQFTIEQKDIFMERSRDAMGALEKDLEILKKEGAELSDDASEELSQARDDLSKALANAEKTGAEGWEESQQAVGKAWTRLQKAYEAARKELTRESSK